MARSHVKELARAAFELEEVVVDEDGDLPFSSGTAMYYASVVLGGQVLRVWSRAVSGIQVNKAVLREIDEANRNVLFARVYTRGPNVFVEGSLPVESLRVKDLAFLCTEVGGTADRVGSMLAAVHGGRVAFPDAHAIDHECED
jgi:hypothetical protein